ncbi:hypothetical protein BEP19_10810 [Ammoniphilus oxalaticus]|uniref:YetF C-terminal domain-containing protein n=1 Tax=Ammoniphilus oxalaticus TaxID=66863 RepID=A0A419SG27_9BACL|nr:DUF421 domain-containing protein [Ammoniphilus oxalaticus]RKD22734.1 hypothetical protein BEP19_10810 [Ammoniphilus oxalaticus]
MPDWVQMIIRSFLMFLFIVTLLRIVGRKQISQMTYSDFVVGITIGTAAALIAFNVIPNLVNGLLGLTAWVLFLIGLNVLTMKSKWFHDLFRGRETILVRRGKVLEDNLKEVQYTPEELLSQLRRKNIFHLADVEFAVMEANGEVSVMLKSEQTPITPKHLEWAVASQAEPQTVVLDGNIMDEALTGQGLNRQWLQTELDKIGISLANVFIGQVDANGDLFVDLFDDAIEIPKPKTKELLYATLKKCEADLAMFALDTDQPEVKRQYQVSSEVIEEVAQSLRSKLIR